VPGHAGVTRRVRRCAAGVSVKVEKKREIIEEQRIYRRANYEYFIQNLIFHYFIEKKRRCVTEREREKGRGQIFEANGMRYRIFYE
jgi:hypothetical protein